MDDHPACPPPVRVQILRVPGCPLAGRLRSLVEWCLSGSGLSAAVEEVEGPYPSPTLLINGIDVTGRPAGRAPSCRLDLPGEQQILNVLNAAGVISRSVAGSDRSQAGARHRGNLHIQGA